MCLNRLQEELYDLQGRWDAQIADASRSNVTRDLELENAKDKAAKVKADLEQRKDDLDR